MRKRNVLPELAKITVLGGKHLVLCRIETLRTFSMIICEASDFVSLYVKSVAERQQDFL